MHSLITTQGRGEEVKNGQRVRHLKNNRTGVVEIGYVSPKRPLDPRYTFVTIRWDGIAHAGNVRLDNLTAEVS